MKKGVPKGRLFLEVKKWKIEGRSEGRGGK